MPLRGPCPFAIVGVVCLPLRRKEHEQQRRRWTEVDVARWGRGAGRRRCKWGSSGGGEEVHHQGTSVRAQDLFIGPIVGAITPWHK